MTITVTRAESAALAVMRRELAGANPAVFRLGLRLLAAHLELELGPTVFARRRGGRTAAELEALAVMRTATGLATDANVCRLGLWHVARAINLELDPAVFAIRGAGRRRPVAAYQYTRPAAGHRD